MCRQKDNQKNSDNSVDIPDLLSPGTLEGKEQLFIQQNQNSEEFYKNKYGSSIQLNSSFGGKTSKAVKSDDEDINNVKSTQFQDKTENCNYPEIPSNVNCYVKKNCNHVV